jgi:hypothetical protein
MPTVAPTTRGPPFAGALLLARTHGAAQITAAAVYSASLSALFGTSALEAFHVYVCAPAACQHAPIARSTG